MPKRLLLGLLVLLNIVGYALPVSACSGGPPPWDEWVKWLLANSDVVVVGQYSQLDDANANGIFHVQSYLQGSGGEYLVISARDTRDIENGLHVERYHYTCSSPSIKQTTGTYVYFLKRQNTGIYVIQHESYFASPDTATSNYYTKDYVETKLDSAGFSADISSRVGSMPKKPQADTPYPRTTPILLTTESNQNFLLPVDNTNLIAIPDDELVDLRRDQYDCSSPCTAYSPNGLDKVYLQTERDEPHDPHDLGYIDHVVGSVAVGQRIVFSATSDSYALWKNDQIQMYALWYPKLGYPYEPMGSLLTPELFNSTEAGISLQFPVAWSPDGRMLAFSTDKGLWLWDALTVGSVPQLLIARHDQVPVARYFSPRGRYLAVEDGDRRYNLDLVSHTELPDGYVSPNDRILLAFDTAAQEPTTLHVMYLAPGIREFDFFPEVKFLKVQWIDDTYFAASITGFSYLKLLPPEPNSDPAQGADFEVVEAPFYDVGRFHSSGGGQLIEDYHIPYLLDAVQMRNFVYKKGPGLIEISVDGYSVSINRGHSPSLASLSFASSLSSPIKEAVWLPSAFYYADTRG